MSFWPTKEHWSVEIPVRSEHYICPALEKDGFVILDRDALEEVAAA